MVQVSFPAKAAPPEAAIPASEQVKPYLDEKSLLTVSRTMSLAAGEIRKAGIAATAALSSFRLAVSAMRSPRTALRAQCALIRALRNADGLSHGAEGGVLGTVARVAGIPLNRRSLAVSTAVSSLKLRVRLSGERHAELVTPGPMLDLINAIEADKQLRAARVMKRMVAEGGADYALASLAPVFIDLVAWNALVDENPFNDESAWSVVVDEAPDAEPLLGFRINWLGRWDKGDGRAVPVPLHDEFPRRTDAGGVLGFVNDIASLTNDGRTMLHRVAGRDGTERFVVLLTGLAFGVPSNPTPNDLVGAFHGLTHIDSPYTRGVRKAIDLLGVPDGAEIAFVGHSQGGLAAMSLTEEADFVARFRVTHVIAVGSPIDYKRPVDPRVQVVSVVNEHDIVPNLDGRSSASPFPLPDGWLEFNYTDTTHAFPLCHAADRYADNLEHLIPEVREQIDSLLESYRGELSETRVFQLYDN
jgi:hypothetical protein